MPSEPRAFDRKAVYHAQLRASSPVSVSLVSAVAQSRYPGRLDYCRFLVEDCAGVYELQVENEQVAEALRTMEVGTGKYYVVAAAGRAESATLQIVGPSDEVTRPYPAASPPSLQRQAPAPEPQPEPSIARSFAEALLAAEKLVAAFRERYGREPTEAERAIASTLFIARDRSNGRRALTSAARGE